MGINWVSTNSSLSWGCIMQDNSPEGGDLDQRFRPEHPPRTWRACCLAPTIAAALVLVIALGTGFLGPKARFAAGRREAAGGASVEQRRQAFIGFGRSCFAIADRADQVSEEAFKALEDMARGNGKLDRVHRAFRSAAQANARASKEFRSLGVPSDLLSQVKIRQSLDKLSEAYDGRRRICEMLVTWNGDVNDRETIARYESQADTVNQLTSDGLRYLGEAAGENQLTREDVEKFVPPGSATAGMLNRNPWGR